MKKNNFTSPPSCHHCGAPATELHEVWSGRYRRDVCIKYHFQVPLCRQCHDIYHSNIKESTRAVCIKWKVDQYKIRLAIEENNDIILSEYSEKILAEYWRVNYEINI